MDRADGAYWRTGGRYSIPETTELEEVDERLSIATSADGVVLRAHTWNMADALVRAAHDERIALYMNDTFPSPYTVEAAHEWIAKASSDIPRNHYAVFNADQLVGGVGFFGLSGERAATYEIGWWLNPDVWGRGIASAAATALVHELFENRGAIRVWAPVMRPNIASGRVAEKAGLALEGIAPDAYVKRGVRYDQLNYGLTRSQWQSRR
jgi:RimJ/RimL family protein N-acetyltransferase